MRLGCSPRSLVAVAVLLTGVAGCGGDEPPEVPRALPGTPPEVEAALLTVEDLGEEWQDLGATPPDQRGVDGCPASNVLAVGEDQERVGEAQTSLSQGPPPSSPLFFESVSLWSSPQVAADRLATFATAGTGCEEFPLPLAGQEATATMTPAPAPELGDDAVALRMDVDVPEGPDPVVDLAAVRIGSRVVFTTGQRFQDLPESSLDRSLFEELTRQAVDKAQATIAAE